MKVKFKDVGRENFNGVIDLADSRGIEKELRKHLLSEDVEIIWTTELTANVIVGGMRKIGEIEIIS